MTLPQAISSCARQAVRFQGRAPRSEYWHWQAFCVAITFMFALIGLYGTATRMLSLILFLPSVAAFTRRLHDSGLSGWWQLLPLGLVNTSLLLLFSSLTPMGTAGPGGLPLDPAASADPALLGGEPAFLPKAGIALGLGLWLYLGTRRGAAGPNRFGPDPLGQTFFMNRTGETLVELRLFPVRGGGDGKNAANLLEDSLPDEAAVLADVFPLTLNQEEWTLKARGESGSLLTWTGLPVRTGRTYILSRNAAEDLPTPDLDPQAA